MGMLMSSYYLYIISRFPNTSPYFCLSLASSFFRLLLQVIIIYSSFVVSLFLFPKTNFSVIFGDRCPHIIVRNFIATDLEL